MRIRQFDSLLPKIPVAPGLWNAHSELSNGDADSALMHLTTPAKRRGRRLDSHQKCKTKHRKTDKIAQISGGVLVAPLAPRYKTPQAKPPLSKPVPYCQLPALGIVFLNAKTAAVARRDIANF